MSDFHLSGHFINANTSAGQEIRKQTFDIREASTLLCRYCAWSCFAHLGLFINLILLNRNHDGVLIWSVTACIAVRRVNIPKDSIFLLLT